MTSGRASMAKCLRGGIGGTVFLGVMILLAGARPASSAKFECAAFLRMHGMLRRASTACGYTDYNPAIVDRARACFDALGSRRGAEAMHSGAAEFERWQAVLSRDALCRTLTDTFPMVVEP